MERLVKYFLITCFLLIVLLRCSDGINSPDYDGVFQFGDTLSIPFNSFKLSDDGRVEVGFVDVLSDSRCPSRLVCFWEGNAEVKLYLKQRRKRNEFELNTFWDFRFDTTISNINIELVRLLPWPETEQAIPKENYSIEIFVNKKI